MNSQIFLQFLAARKKKKIKKKAPVPPRWLYPTNAEKQYDKTLYSLVKELKSLIKEIILPEIPYMIEEVERKMPNDRRADEYLEDLARVVIMINKILEPKIKETIAKADLIWVQISDFNKQQFQKMNHSVFGIDIFVDEPWLLDQLKLFSAQNSQLIKSLPEQELSRVSGIIERGLQQGLRFTDMTESIQKSFGITHRRAKLIARDQTQKLNSSLTKLRQQQVGVEEYEWQTSLDERVRPTHRANEGKIFRWDSPPPITGHPGHDINCRCTAIAVLDKLLDLG